MKYRLFLSKCLVLVILVFTAQMARAYTVHLDGVANAGWHAYNLDTSYLNIINPENGSYYYHWEYGGTTALTWSTHDELRNDLSDGYLGDSSSGIELQDWAIESSGDVFGTPVPIIQSIELPKGWYEINLVTDSNAYNILSPWDGDGNEWNAYVQFFGDFGSFSYGNTQQFFDDQQATLDYYSANHDGTTFFLEQDSQLFYFINDINSIDNASSVTLDITSTSVPVPGSFLLLGSGMALVAIRRKISAMS